MPRLGAQRKCQLVLNRPASLVRPGDLGSARDSGVRSLAVSANPASRVKVMLQKKVGTRYVNVRAAYTSTRGAITFTKLTKGAYHRVYVYASAGRNAAYSGAARVVR